MGLKLSGLDLATVHYQQGDGALQAPLPVRWPRLVSALAVV